MYISRLLYEQFFHVLAIMFALSINLSFAKNNNTIPLVVVVHQDNLIEELERRDVIDIYMGRFQTFPNGKPVDPIDFPNMSEERRLFYKKLVGKSEKKINAYWSRLLFSGRAKPPRQAQSTLDVIETIKPESIAYVHPNDVTEDMKIVFHF